MSTTVSSSGTIISYSNTRWAHTEGNQIVDNKGNSITLRGTNFWGYEIGTFNSHTEQDYERIAAMGFNVVRLPIAWSYIEPSPGIYNASYLNDIVSRDITWAKENGLYIILDMHQWYWSPHFNFIGSTACGMPTWLVSNYANNNSGLALAIDDFWRGRAPNGMTPSESNPSMQERFIAVWKYVAKNYAKEPTIIAYDLFNEPNNGGEFDAAVGMDFTQASYFLNSFYPKLIDGVRMMDKTHILMYEPIGGWAVRAAAKIDKPNLIFSFHWYGSFYKDYKGNITEMESFLFDNRLNVPTNYPIKDWNIPLFIGEFGADDWRPNPRLYTEHTLQLWEKNHLGWAWWTYDKSNWYGKALLYANGSERIVFTEPLSNYAKLAI